MRKRKGNILVSVLVVLCVAIYIFFSGETKEPFVPHYYTWNGRDIYYESKPDQIHPDHYVLAVTQIPHSAESPRDKPSEPFGDEAKKFVQAALRSRDIYLEHLGHSLYVYVWLDAPADSSDVKNIEQRMLNAQLISRGYSKYLPSRTPTGIINSTYEKVFLALQKEAQNKRVGIWSLSKKSTSETRKSDPEKISVYLGEKRVLIDPNDDDDEEQLSQPAKKGANVGINVVVTPKGKKYHYANCRTVKKSYRTLTVAQARKQGYKPCKVCNPPSY